MSRFERNAVINIFSKTEIYFAPELTLKCELFANFDFFCEV